MITVFYSNTEEYNEIFNGQEFKDDFTKIYSYCLEEQRNFSELIAIIIANKESTGMKLELEQAMQDNQSYHLIIHEDHEERDNREWLNKYFDYAKQSWSVSWIARWVDNIEEITRKIIKRTKSF